MKREVWLDYLRAFACILVTVGHLLKSLEEASIIKDCMLVSLFVQMIYHFHVNIFFFCSGYLFQKSYSTGVGQSGIVRKFIRCIDLVVPYVVFSAITYVIKVVLGSDVNSPIENSLIGILLNKPINQMWYLYALIMIMMLTPVIKSGKMAYIIFCLAFGVKVVLNIGNCAIEPVRYLFGNEIWFVLGMLWNYKKIELNKVVSVICGILFILLALYEYKFGITNVWFNFILTFIGLFASIGIVWRMTHEREKMTFVWKMLSKYMFQIYLMHTICAAGIRIILMRLENTSIMIHTIMGLIFSFCVPVICAMIAEKTKILNIVFFPSKTILVSHKSLGLDKLSS